MEFWPIWRLKLGIQVATTSLPLPTAGRYPIVSGLRNRLTMEKLALEIWLSLGKVHSLHHAEAAPAHGQRLRKELRTER